MPSHTLPVVYYMGVADATDSLSYSPRSEGIFPPNPLLVLRTSRGLTRSQFAEVLGTSKTTVQFAEEGCFLTIPVAYRKFLTREDHLTYQEFRLAKRKHNFPDPEGQFPPHCRTMRSLLDHLGLSPYQFAERCCVQHSEIWRMYHNKRPGLLPSNLLQAFTQIGVSAEFIREFR